MPSWEETERMIAKLEAELAEARARLEDAQAWSVVRMGVLENELAEARAQIAKSDVALQWFAKSRTMYVHELAEARKHIAAKDAEIERYRKALEYLRHIAGHEVLEEIIDAALSTPAQGDMVLVPREPDDAMIEAGQDVVEDKRSWGGNIYAADIYAAMIAASQAASDGENR